MKLVNKFLIFILLIATSQASTIVEVCPNPYGRDYAEYVKLFVTSPCILSDGEGEIKINKTGYVIVAKNLSAFYKSFGVKADYEFTKKFALSNSGDQLFLIENNLTVDKFSYGKCKEGVVYFKHKNVWDFRYQDWTNFSTVKDFVKGKLIVTPCNYNFKCDECALIASYTFTNLKLIKNFKDVEIFVDATPVGGIPVEEIEISRICKLNFLKSNSYKNFHYKFGLCKNKVIITTENWVWNNRGYIVEFESEKVAKLLRSVLKHDRKYRSQPGKVGSVTVKDKFGGNRKIEFESYVEVFIIPDRNPILDLISNAKRRVYIETPYIEFGYYNNTPILDTIKNAAKNAEVKVLLDSKYNKEKNLKTIDFLREIAKTYNLNIEAKLIELNGFRSLHGKLAVVDDKVLITSANFNMYGFKLNREVGIVIYSKKVSDFLASQFMEDFGYEKKMDYLKLIPLILLLSIALLVVLKALYKN